MHRFGKCRMRKDHRQEAFVCGLQVTGDAKALDLFRDLCANHMRAQQLAGFSIENRLHKTLCLAAGQRLTIALIRELTDPDGPSPCQGRRFRQAQTGNLGPGISATRHIVAIERVGAFDTGQGLNAEHAFVAGLVRQTRRAGYIADGIKPKYVSATSRVRLDKTAV